MSNPEGRVREIQNLVAAGHFAAARERCTALTRAAPADPNSWRLAADVAWRMGAKADALTFLRRAVACAPGEVTFLIQLGQYLLGAGHRTEALVVALQAERSPIERPGLADAIGTLLTHCGEPGRALQWFERAVAAAPANPAFRYNLAMAQRMTGALEFAEANLDLVLTANPLDGEAQHARSGLRKQTRDRNHVAELETAVAQLDGRPGGVGILFALAKEFEDLADYRRAFVHLTDGCCRVRASYRYDVAGDLAVLEALQREHSARRLAECAASRVPDRPTFIIGLPRSGTTLVERILGSHTEVFSAGELDAFPAAAIDAVSKRCGGPVSKLEFVGRSLELDFDALGNAYIAAARARAGSAQRFTDKLPFNYLYAGLIHAALPRAKFVALRRHPMDLCYAMYKTLFASAYPFTYDLIELARYYVAWDQLMRHWEMVIGRAWLTVNYEDMVLSQDRCTRNLLAHCGLPWEERCLDFHSNSQPVATASAVQVRRPLYSDSIGKWRAYATELQPLKRYLEQHGVMCT